MPWTQADVDAINARRGAKLPAHLPPDYRDNITAIEAKVKPQKQSKYRNVRTKIGAEVFDSKREANHWLLLQARQELKEITALRRQVEFPLYCPTVRVGTFGVDEQVSAYIADFVYEDAEGLHVVDAKGKRTQMYALKKKWLELQTGIVIEEI